MPAQHQFNQIEPYRLYDAQFVADLAGVSRRVVYDSAADKRSVDMPAVTRLAKNVIRFRGQHILEWLDRAAGIEAAEPVAIEPESTKRGRGRPRKSASAGCAA